MTTKMDGSVLAKEIQEDLRQKVDELSVSPTLMIISVGEDGMAVKSRETVARKVGVSIIQQHYPTTIDEATLVAEIGKFNQDDAVQAIMLQLPLPKQLHIEVIREAITPKKEIEGQHPYNIGRLSQGNPLNYPSVTKAVIKILESYNIELEGKHAVVVGRGQVVGKPMAQLLLDKNATVTITHSKTTNLSAVTKLADILIVAIGKGHFITKEYVKKGAVVIDVGMSFTEEGKMMGDVAFDEVQELTSYITPVPGGVGPMNTTMLMAQVIECAAKQ